MKSNLAHTLVWLAMPMTSMAAEPSASTTSEVPTTPPTEIQENWTASLGTGVQLGGHGLGGHLTYSLLPSLYFKLEGNYAGYEDTITVDHIDYEGDFEFSNLGITTNYLPFEDSGFKIVGGIFFSPCTFDGSASAEGERIQLGTSYYTFKKNDALHLDVEYNTVIPYFGIGWDWVFGESKNYVIGVDLGVSYLGDPEVDLIGTGQFSANFIQGDIRDEEGDLQEDAEDYTFFPTLKISFTYRF